MEGQSNINKGEGMSLEKVDENIAEINGTIKKAMRDRSKVLDKPETLKMVDDVLEKNQTRKQELVEMRKVLLKEDNIYKDGRKWT